jgi:very-short-patch-repair endonuclease
MTSTFRAFASFSEASAFAKRAALERQCSVSVFQQGDKWLVEVLGILDSKASETNIAPKIAKPKLKYRPFLPRKCGSITQRIADSRRSGGTRAEIVLEHILLNVGGGMFRGRFQREWAYGGRWIVDFYFPEVRLGVEVDGGYHNHIAQQHRDKERENALAMSGITIIRLKNDEVFGDRESLLLKLHSGWRKAKIVSRKFSERTKPLQRRPIVPSRSPRQPNFVSAPPFNGGWTTLKQGENRVGDAYEKVYANEGIAGSRDEQRAMNKQQFSDMRKRSRGQ